MPRLNDQFIEALTVDGSRLKVEAIGYQIVKHEQDDVSVDVSLNAWLEPYVTVQSSWRGALLKGGIALTGVGRSFKSGGLHQPGLHVGANDEAGDRRYWIVDSAEEEVLVSFWDPAITLPDPDGFSSNGAYGDYVPVPLEEAETVKGNAQRVIDVVKMAVDANVMLS